MAKWVEDVCTGQSEVFVYLVLRCHLGCCTWFGCCAANVGLIICVWYSHVPGHWLSSGPWQASGPIWAFVVIPHQVDWLFNCWHLCSLDRSPQDVIQMTDVVWEHFCGRIVHAAHVHPLPVCGSQALESNLLATATLMASSDSFIPTAVISGACSQSPECGVAAAISLTLSTSDGALERIRFFY